MFNVSKQMDVDGTGHDERIELGGGSGRSGARGGVGSLVVGGGRAIVGGGVLGLPSAHLRPLLPGGRRQVLARAVPPLPRVRHAARRLQILLRPSVQNLLPPGLHQVSIHSPSLHRSAFFLGFFLLLNPFELDVSRLHGLSTLELATRLSFDFLDGFIGLIWMFDSWVTWRIF